MIFFDPSPPLLSHDLQEVIGCALVDETFKDLLLASPRKALAGFELTPADKRAACSITGASTLAEYAILLEQRLARRKPGQVALGRAADERPKRSRRVRAAS
ncbi:MAG TPA: hypothetical protein VK009_09590 [Chloroflexota bacterium]|nr:hypothetical protein [Chloroflexota bacterium]